MRSTGIDKVYAVESTALAEITPIPCIRLVSSTFRRAERNEITLKTFTNDTK